MYHKRNADERARWQKRADAITQVNRRSTALRWLPTLLREDPSRFFFYSNEGTPREPPHIHVTAEEKIAKFWLDPVEMASSRRLRSGEIATLRNIVKQRRREFVEAWHAHFDT